MEQKVLSVSELTNVIKIQLEDVIGAVSVQGEISNYKEHSSGHRYFTLKDENAQISCTMWRTRPISFQPKEGMKVIIQGNLTVYPPRGNYQIDCWSMTPVGQGDLYLAFEALKKKLGDLGYFDMNRKRPLPDMPLFIGVATSPTGAAVRDIFSTIERRFPAVIIYFRPTVVQGGDASADIVKAIEELHQTPSQVLIIGRGGGSIEDLWAFNTEIVANSIYNSTLPIVSAVGHETDFTIADFVADVRAATPTAAAELVTSRTSQQIIEFLDDGQELLTKLIKEYIREKREIIQSATGTAASRRLLDQIKLNYQQIDEYDLRIQQNIKHKLTSSFQKLDSLESHCRSLAPLAPLGRGFAILKHQGKIISNSNSLVEFKNVEILRENETAEVKIIKILPKNLF